jgi:hypothetical protein
LLTDAAEQVVALPGRSGVDVHEQSPPNAVHTTLDDELLVPPSPVPRPGVVELQPARGAASTVKRTRGRKEKSTMISPELSENRRTRSRVARRYEGYGVGQ